MPKTCLAAAELGTHSHSAKKDQEVNNTSQKEPRVTFKHRIVVRTLAINGFQDVRAIFGNRNVIETMKSEQGLNHGLDR